MVLPVDGPQPRRSVYRADRVSSGGHRHVVVVQSVPLHCKAVRARRHCEYLSADEGGHELLRIVRARRGDRDLVPARRLWQLDPHPDARGSGRDRKSGGQHDNGAHRHVPSPSCVFSRTCERPPSANNDDYPRPLRRNPDRDIDDVLLCIPGDNQFTVFGNKRHIIHKRIACIILLC